MKVIYILEIFPKISETFIQNEINCLLQQNIEVEIFALKNSHENLDKKISDTLGKSIFYAEKDSIKNRIIGHSYFIIKNPFLYLRWFLISSSSPHFGLKRRFLKELKNIKTILGRNPDHLHAHFGCRTADIAFLAKLLTGIDFTFTTHRRDIFETPPINYRIKSKYAKKHITISEYNKNYLIQHFGVNPRDIEVVHCGVDSKKIQPTRSVPSNWPPRIITIARLSHEKALENLIESCRLLRDRGIRFHCDIVGEGNQRELLRSLIHGLNLQTQVKLLGSKTNETVLQLIKKANLMVLPSLSEGLSVAIMEAMASGIPVVTTDVTGIRELIDDNVTGYIVPPKNIQALANKLFLLLQNENMLRNVVSAARNKILAEFDLEQQTKKLLSVWRV